MKEVHRARGLSHRLPQPCAGTGACMVASCRHADSAEALLNYDEVAAVAALCGAVREGGCGMDHADAVPIADLLDERRHLLDLAYWMLGSTGEAESVVDETYGRWYGLSDAARRQITA